MFMLYCLVGGFIVGVISAAVYGWVRRPPKRPKIVTQFDAILNRAKPRDINYIVGNERACAPLPNAAYCWTCPACRTVNSINDTCCMIQSCGTRRPEK